MVAEVFAKSGFLNCTEEEVFKMPLFSIPSVSRWDMELLTRPEDSTKGPLIGDRIDPSILEDS